MKMGLAWLVCSAATVLPQAALAGASPGEFPTRPIRMVLPVGPGGGQDTTMRTMNQKLSENLGQSVIIDPRPGGGGNIAGQIVASATPNGYTILSISTTAITTPLLSDVAYDLQRDFVGVTQLISNPYLLVATTSLPANTVSEFIKQARANPDKFAYASAGSGSLTHLGVEIFRLQAGIQINHIPYKGMGPSGPDLIAGRVHLGFWSIVSAQPHVRANRLKALAVTSAMRSKASPDVPTIAESGLPGFDVTQWYGVIAPARTPRPIVDRLSRAMAGAIQDPAVAARIANDGAQSVGSSPKEFDLHLRTEHAKWSKVVSQLGMGKGK